MSGGRLAEQMGAMALVDDLRHRRMEIEEHLDLAKREAEVAERIRTYYKSQGVECNDELIEQGVSEYFKQRLTFESPTLTAPAKKLAFMITSSTLHRCLDWLALLFFIMWMYHSLKSFFR
ncbi:MULTISPECIES: DUF6384 family protein [unclassified Pseudomonas]|jgi:hypothetical protein|uniref:DUF6384 family protein n=1 Tax=unclassified Pseudomonas TaxID=196821 RepID=UPI000BA4AAEA|nr:MULTISPECIES: DUF6384 family protein [unclassified Pseudomonas]MCU1721735.1 DUF6384 family protein [Pseudomonas sp. 5P_5.1_Bac1]MCU1733321.1 DUF6384 family protein [Pseudomonas sp. 20P_3.2_Bac4]MCU1747729.1 DUF6384 family protein [Pseudomonas sp. 20P_3.2_Bac5]